MVTININFLRTELGEIADQGEHGRTQLDFSLPEEFRTVDYVNVEFRKGNKEVEVIERLIPNNDHLVVPLDQNITDAAGRINIQVVGYVLNEDEIVSVIKSPIVCGSIHRSLNVLFNYNKAGIAERLVAFIEEWARKLSEIWGAKHSHKNQELLDSITQESFSDLTGQANWNENDEMRPGYVKNRTHWLEPAYHYELPENTEGAQIATIEYDTVDNQKWHAIYYKVGDVISDQDFLKGKFKFKMVADGNTTELIVNVADIGISEEPMYANWEVFTSEEVTVVTTGSLPLIVIIKDGTKIDKDFIITRGNDELTAEDKTGVYLLNCNTEGMPITSDDAVISAFEEGNWSIDYIEYGELYHPLHPDFLPKEVKDPQLVVVENRNFVGRLPAYGCVMIDPKIDAHNIDIRGFYNPKEYDYPEYLLDFMTGDNPPSLSLPSNIEWQKEPTLEANKHYQISIRNGIALWCAVDRETEELDNE